MASKRLEGVQVVMVIAPEQFRDEELSVPQEAFLAEGARVRTASTRLGEAKGMLGATADVGDPRTIYGTTNTCTPC